MNPMYRRVAIALVLIMVIALLGGFFASVARPHSTGPSCTDFADDVNPISVTVDGQRATGFVAYPSSAPKGIVAFAHGYGHTALSWSHHLRWAARELGVVAVAMDYRGLKVTAPKKDGDLPGSRGWPVQAGALDTIAGTQALERCAKGPNVMFGVSMGGNVSGLVVAEGAQRKDKSGPLFDYWIDVEGVTNMAETYLEARALQPALGGDATTAVEDISAETGGPIEAVPQAYAKRSVVTRGADIAAGGLKGAVIIHGVDDGKAGYNQSVEMAAALEVEGVPAQLFTVLRRTPESERETTLTGYVGSKIDPKYTSPFAGHASETSFVHIVMKTAFDRLIALYRGELPDCTGTHLVDGDSPALGAFAGC